jgi:hypothetical protein
VRGPRRVALIAVLAAVSAVSCTVLVTFDDHGDASCGDADCDGGFDATMGADAVDDTDFFPMGDATVSADVGDCTVLSEGEPCAKADACRHVSTCKGGVCTTHPLEDGTVCGTAPDDCHDAPVCADGACAPATATTDGTACGTAPDDCHDAPVCMSGACAAPANVADGTSCGAAPDDCHDAPACKGGTCGDPANAANGKACGSAPDSCHHAPACSDGSCAAAAAFAEGAKPTGGAADDHCCGGKAVDTSTDDSNCGVCGVVCRSGQTCGAVDGEYFCKGCAANDDCWSGCCSISPAPDHCSPSNCSGACQADICPDGAHCVVGTSVDYCTY